MGEQSTPLVRESNALWFGTSQHAVPAGILADPMEHPLRLATPLRVSPPSASPIAIRLSYLICSTPRSGSNFLCEVLCRTGVAGRPDDYFWNRPFWYERWDVTEFRGFAHRLLQEGSTPNGVFGSKLMWDQLEDVVTQFATLLGLAGVQPPEVLAAAFPNLHFVWLTRRDKVRQGISYYRALETKIWRSTDVSQSPVTDPPFNFDAIDSLVQLSRWEDQAWQDFFRRHAIEPFVVTYEELSRAPIGVARRMLHHLAIPPPVRLQVRGWRHQRQADVLSDEWVECYNARTRAVAASSPSGLAGASNA